MKRLVILKAVAFFIFAFAITSAVSIAIAGGEMKSVEQANIILTDREIKYADGPASLPAGSKVAVLEGDPKNPGPVTLRLKLPAGYKIAPHAHPGDERVTVLEGTLFFGLGEKMDASKAGALKEGSFFVIPSNRGMFAFTKGKGAIIQLNVMGPWDVKYINPADDPRNKK